VRKLGLFGKILIAFWLTLLALAAALTVVLGSASKEDRSSLRLGPSFLLVLERTLEREGANSAERQRRLLTRSVRTRITIAEDGLRPDFERSESATLRQAVAPDGRTFVIRYHREPAYEVSEVPAFAVWGAAVAGLLFSVAIAAYLSRPLRLLRDGFDRLAGGDLEIRLAGRVGRRSDEFGDLARDFDVMAERLGQLVVARDRLLNDVSHEFRSPLTRLQLAVGLARQDPERTEASLSRIEQEAHRLDLLVDGLLTLARAESGADIEGFFDPVGVVADVVADAGLEANAKGCCIAWTEPLVAEDERPVVAGSPELLRRAVENVLRNAIRFLPPRASIEVTVEIRTAPPVYRIVVQDQGPGVQPELIDKLFEPFVRADQSGTGLGLAIAKRAVRAHHGSITCRNRQGGGLAVVIELPAQQA
jgi:two-component system OmpR family sensor kinase